MVCCQIASPLLQSLTWRVPIVFVVHVDAFIVVAVIVELLVHFLILQPLLLALEVQRFADENPPAPEWILSCNGAEAFVKRIRRLRGVSDEIHRVSHRLADERRAPVRIDGMRRAVY